VKIMWVRQADLAPELRDIDKRDCEMGINIPPNNTLALFEVVIDLDMPLRYARKSEVGSRLFSLLPLWEKVPSRSEGG
jgi:hypothetical protein